MNGYERVSVSPVHTPPRAPKAAPFAINVKVDDVVHVLRFATHDEAVDMREQPVESIVETCEQLQAARAAETPSPTPPASARFADRVALLIGQEVFVRFDTPRSSRRHGQHARGVLTEVGEDGVVVRFSPRATDRRPIPWSKLQYVALPNPGYEAKS